MTARYLVADVFDGLATLEDGTVDLVVTSPPFLALRSYLPADDPLKSKEIGSEPTPAAFLDVMLAFTAELRRVLAPHGSICVELGDTYAGSGGAGGDYAENGLREGQPTFKANPGRNSGTRYQKDGMPSIPARERQDDLAKGGPGWPLNKSKTLIPELYRIALAYGINPLTGEPSPAGQWRVRNVVTWARPNPAVGMLGDKWRPATSDVVVACVSGKRYWDDLATRRQLQASTQERMKNAGYVRSLREGVTDNSQPIRIDTFTEHAAGGAPLLDYWEIPLDPDEEPTRYGPKEPKPKGQSRHREGAEARTDLPSQQRDGNWRSLPQTNDDENGRGSPLLDYWVIPPGGYTGSHYAVFPPELVVPLVKAMCPKRVCRECGEPSRRIVSDASYVGAKSGKPYEPHVWESGLSNGRQAHSNKKPDEGARAQFTTEGWTDCGHDNYRPGLVLDPFAGSGTTLLVATGHGHDAIGIDLDRRNAELALQRVGPFLLTVEELEMT